MERALRVLDAFPEVEGDVGTNELARVTGINASTVSRILATLAAAGYVEHRPASGRYRLGPQVLRLSSHALGGVDLRAAARPHLDELVDETGETATLSVPGELPAAPLARYTEHTITDPARLADEVAAVRRIGHAHASREREPDLNAVAVPVFGEPGELIAILGVQGPESRFRLRAQDAAVPLLRSHALALSAALGYAVA